MIRRWPPDDLRLSTSGCNQLINQAAHAWLGLNGSHDANDVTEKSKGTLINTTG